MNKPLIRLSVFFLSFNLRGTWLMLFFLFGFYPVFPNNLDSLFSNGIGRIDTRVFSASEEALSPEKLMEPEFFSQFTPLPVRKTFRPGKIYWYRLDFGKTNLSESDEWIIRFPKYDNITLYFQQSGSFVSTSSGRMDRRKSDQPYYAVDFVVSKDQLIEGRYLLAQIQHVFRSSGFMPAMFLHPFIAKLDREFYTLSDIYNYIPYILFIGGMLLMIFYSFGIYFMNRDKLFNYYAIYLLTLFLYLGVRMPLFFGPLELRYPLLMHVYNELIQVLVNIFYLVFASFFLNARYDFPKLYKAIRYAIWFLGGLMVLQLLLILSNRFAWIESYVVQFERYFMILFSLLAYVHILLNYKNKIVFFLVIGSLFFLAGGIMAMFLHNIRYMMLGAGIEVFVFSLGMGYQIKLVEQTKQSIENEMNKLRLTALRAQMNPHFIFNSLNSIRAYVISSETKKASDYLNKFARLIRLILHYSSKDFISLKEELEALALYVELEQMRFREDFGFVLKIGSDVDTHNWQVPPLILQPYVENAIVHGLAPKTGVKELLVEVSKNKSKLSFIIRDNGVGRSYSKNTRFIQNPQHKSIAMELARKRIELTADKQTENENIKILDLTENGHPTGTEVRIKLPVHTIE
ncbi:MAG: histidine kinase [Bacteroidales bacterium]|nr:histidine kinase [Bacteroidales bacterium]